MLLIGMRKEEKEKEKEKEEEGEKREEITRLLPLLPFPPFRFSPLKSIHNNI